MFILAQVFNAIGTFLNIVGINIKKKQLTLIFFAIGNTFVPASLGLLNAYSGMMIQIVFVIQSIINYFWEKKNPKYPLWLILLYVIIPSIITLIGFTSCWDILPLLAAIMFPLALVSKDFVLRSLNLISVVFWIPYDLNFGQYVGVISCTIFIILNFLAIYRFDIKKNTKTREI